MFGRTGSSYKVLLCFLPGALYKSLVIMTFRILTFLQARLVLQVCHVPLPQLYGSKSMHLDFLRIDVVFSTCFARSSGVWMCLKSWSLERKRLEDFVWGLRSGEWGLGRLGFTWRVMGTQ